MAKLKLRLVHGVNINSALNYFKGFFKRVSDSHNHRTRASDYNVNIFRFRTLGLQLVRVPLNTQVLWHGWSTKIYKSHRLQEPV